MSVKKSFQLSIPIQEDENLESTSDWKNVIFLPFNTVWVIALLVSVLVNAVLSVYDICFLEEEHSAIAILYHACELFYFADILLIIMHRNYPLIRKRRSHQYRGLGFIAINMASVIPLYELTYYLSIPDFIEEDDVSRNYMKLKCLIRVYRIFEYINGITNRPGLSISAILTLAYLTRIFVIGHLMAAVMFLVVQSEGSNWTKNLKNHKFDRKSPFHWYTITFTLMTGNMLHNSPSVIKPESNQEMIFYIFTLLVGYTLHMMIFIANLISMFKKDHMNYFEFETQVSKIMGLLEEWEVDDELKQKTIDYYSVFWQKRCGLRDMPEMFNLLPPSLKKEVTVDIFWEALRHSHFFVGTDMSFKRSVSLIMKSEFLLPGDFLFRIDELKTKMVYIVSGVVQILSNEDDDSPIMSFSSGTLLGETGCLIATTSPANLRTATYCEIQTLYLTDLYKVLLNYPVIAKYIKQQLSNRLIIAKHDVVRENASYTSTGTTIKAVREFWNDIWLSGHKKSSALNIQRRKHRIRTDNLDLLALSDEVELRVDAICLSGQCPFIMDPDTSFRKFCDIVVIVAVIVQSFMIPKSAFFNNKMTDGEMSTLFLMDLIYFVDIYLQISTAVKSNNGLITDFKDIIVIRLKQIRFLIDLLATFPVDYIILMTSSNLKLVAYYKLLRLFKAYKVIYMLKFLEKLYVIDTNVIKLVKYTFLYFSTIYWLTCLMNGVSSLDETGTNWFEYNLKLFNLSLAEHVNHKFFASVAMTVGGYLNYGTTGFDMYSFHDTWFYFFVILCGHLLFSYGFAELTAAAVLKHDAERTNRTYLLTLKREATQYKIDPSVHIRVSNFLNFHYSVREGCQISGEEGIFENAPLELRNEIVRHRIVHCLKKVPLFADASDDLLRYVVAHSEIKLVPSGSTILKAENKSDLLYVIMRGYCKMWSTLPGDLERNATAILQSGSTFPFLETFHGAFSFLTVKSMTVAELLLIRTKIIINAFQTYEADYGSFRQALKDHKTVYGSILFRKGARLPFLQSVQKAKKKGSVFEYNLYDIDDVKCNETAYRQPFIKLGVWSFFRFLLMRKTINPHKWYYSVWEIFRAIVAVVYAICAISMSTLLGHTMKPWAVKVMFAMFDVACYADLYVRLHCQYYNRKGILVTHPLSTARHYIKTSFCVDLISFIPISNIQLDYYLGKRHHTLVMILTMLFTRLLQLHRPLSGLTYLENRFKGKRGLTIHMIKYLLLIIVATNFCQTLAMLVLCEAEDVKLYCSSQRGKDYEYLRYFVEFFHNISTYFTLATTGNMISTHLHGIVFIVLLIPMFMLRWAFLITTTSKAIGGNVELTLYRDRMKSYMEFLKGAFVSDGDKQLIVDHYEYVWKKSQGMNMYHVLKYFHPQLEQDMAYNLYSNTLLTATVFQGEHHSLFQALTPLFHREYYTKDSKILQCNDIQQKIFFVHEGTVAIYIANTQVCVLESGGMFGCFSKSGVTRQTLTAITKIHSTVLTVDSTLFHKTIQSFPRVMERLRRANSLNYEYLKETKGSETITTAEKAEEKVSSGLYDEYKSFFDKIYIKEDGVGFKTFNYLISVHVYPLGSIFILAAIFINFRKALPTEILYITYSLDVIHLVMMGLKFHKIYLDPVSGSLVKDPYVIRRSYAKTTFWLDFLTIVPFDMMSFSLTNDVFIHNLCRLNKSFRFIFLMIYYYQCEERLSMKKHLKWTYMIYSTLFLVQLFVCLWLFAACPNTRCYYNTERTGMTTYNVVGYNNTLSSTLVAYLFIVNMYTGAGSTKTSPVHMKEIVIACVVALATQYIIVNLCSGYTSMILVDKHNFSRFEVRFKRLSTYLQGRQLSPSLYAKVSKYCLRLWQCQRGDWLPAMIQESPNSLKENMMQILYGKNLSNHFLFSATHKDFLRQLVVHLERFVFSPGDSIVEKGDSDCCMYFVNKGEVNVYFIEGKTERKIQQLNAGMSFGEAQGLYCISHQFSYRANTICDVLILNKTRWEYLLKWFPASREEIVAKAAEHDLDREVDQANEEDTEW